MDFGAEKALYWINQSINMMPLSHIVGIDPMSTDGSCSMQVDSAAAQPLPSGLSFKPLQPGIAKKFTEERKKAEMANASGKQETEGTLLYKFAIQIYFIYLCDLICIQSKNQNFIKSFIKPD